MPERSFDAVVFDMDGVLAQSDGVYERHWRAWAVERGLDSEAPIAVHHGRPALETIALIAPDLDGPREAAAFNQRVIDDPEGDGVTVLDGAADALASLPRTRWTIATSTPRVLALRWLALLGLPIPDALVTVDDVVRGKPAPDPYLRAAELLGVRPEGCLVIEDAPAGIASAKAAGASVLALLTTHASSDLEAADAVTRDLTAVSLRDGGSGVIVGWTDARRAGDG